MLNVSTDVNLLWPCLTEDFAEGALLRDDHHMSSFAIHKGSKEA